MPRHKPRPNTLLVGDYVRSSFFGIEDSLVSTTGLIAGIAVATTDKQFIILAGLVAIAVEAISMAAGEFLSEETEHDMDDPGSRRTRPIVGGLIMLVSYAVAGLVPLLPVMLLPGKLAIVAAVVAALIGLFVLGYFKGQITQRSPLRSGFKVLIVGGLATLIGIVVGIVFKTA